MITVASPLFIVAGALLAGAALVLHLLVRRPPPRQPLPTARFLTPAAHTRLRLQSRPVDPWVLLVRVLMALCLGALFAGVTWHPARSGAVRVILLDAGADSASEWSDLQAEAVRVSETRPTDAVPQILVYGTDDPAHLVGIDEVENLARGARPVGFAEGLRAVRTALSSSRYASAEVTWVTHPTWDDWSTGVGHIRSDLWPGSVRIQSVAAHPPAASAGEIAPSAPSAFVEGASPGAPLPRALIAAGYALVLQRTSLPAGGIVFGGKDTASPVDLATEGGATGAATRAETGTTAPVDVPAPAPVGGRRGTTWITSGPPDGIAWLNGSRSSAAAADALGLILPDGVTLDVVLQRGGGQPADGARVLAVFTDATPAVAAIQTGEDCHVHSSASLEEPALTGHPDFPLFVEALARGCTGDDGGTAPLDSGALETIERADLPDRVMAADLGLPGRSLARVLALISLLLLSAERALTRHTGHTGHTGHTRHRVP